MTSSFSVGVIQTITGQQERQYGVQAVLAPRRADSQQPLGQIRRTVTSVQQETQYYLKEAPRDYIRSLQKAGSSTNYMAELEGARSPDTDTQPAIVQMFELYSGARGQEALNPDFILEHMQQLEDERIRLAAEGGQTAVETVQETEPAAPEDDTIAAEAVEYVPDQVDCEDPVQAVQERECIYAAKADSRASDSTGPVRPEALADS